MYMHWPKLTCWIISWTTMMRFIVGIIAAAISMTFILALILTVCWTSIAIEKIVKFKKSIINETFWYFFWLEGHQVNWQSYTCRKAFPSLGRSSRVSPSSLCKPKWCSNQILDPWGTSRLSVTSNKTWICWISTHLLQLTIIVLVFVYLLVSNCKHLQAL